MAGNLTDGDIVRRIASSSRDHEAEAELCRRFGRRAMLYGARHVRDADAARDLAQAVLVAVLEAARAGRIEDGDHVDRFVLGTCRNVALRMRQTAGRIQPTTEEELDVRSAVPSLEPLDTGALIRCLAALDLRGRTVIQQSFLEDRSAEEIAADLATTAGNVRVVRHRAIAQLRDCMERAPVAS